MRIRKGEEWKRAFQKQYGYFEYQLIVFGLSNALASFHGYINQILVEKLDVFVILYLGDNLIYTKNASQGYVHAVCWVLADYRKHDLFANLKKYCFH